MDIELKPSIDLQLYCCKFYSQEAEVQHTYLLAIPGKNDSDVQQILIKPLNLIKQTLKLWISQPWYYHSVIEK